MAKTALITGVSRGIGKAAAIRLAEDGYDIIGTCRSSLASLEETRTGVERCGRVFRGAVFDVADRAEAGKQMTALFGDSAPDVVVYNAGVTRDNMFVFMSPEEWDTVLRTNLDGFYNTVQPLLFGMVARRSGRIIVITSASGQSGQAGQVNYAASKAALAAAVKSLAREVGRKGILVNAVSPGVIDTDMTSELPKDAILPMIPLRRTGKPEEVAGVIRFLCSPDSSYIHGQVIAVNGGLLT